MWHPGKIHNDEAHPTRGTKRWNDEKQIKTKQTLRKTKQTSHMKTPTHKHKRKKKKKKKKRKQIATEEQPWNGHWKTFWGWGAGEGGVI